jgi:hypothetical protein
VNTSVTRARQSRSSVRSAPLPRGRARIVRNGKGARRRKFKGEGTALIFINNQTLLLTNRTQIAILFYFSQIHLNDFFS